MKMRFVGGAPAEIMDTPLAFKRYGQLFELPDTLGHAIDNLALLPDSEFSKLAFTQAELDQWGDFKQRYHAAPAAFIEKVKAGWRLRDAWLTNKTESTIRLPIAVIEQPVAPAEEEEANA